MGEGNGQTLDLNIKGLYTAPNPFSAVPQGALTVADNVVLDNESVAQTRRGESIYGTIFSSPIEKMFQYKNYLLAAYGGAMALDSDNNGTWTAYSGSFDAPSNTNRMRSVESNKNFYLTSSTGIRKLDDPTSAFRVAGAVIGLGGSGTLTNPGFMSDQVQVAYRIVWGYRDINSNEIVGVPSQRLVMVNDTGATADVTQVWQIPEGVDSTWFYRVFRSGESAGVDFSPDDELQQVKEGNPTSAELSAGEISFTDSVPNSLRGAFLYTDPSQEGIGQSNYPPPIATDVTLFKNHVFYFNTVSKQQFFLTLLGVGDNTTGAQFGYQTNDGDTHTNTTIDGLTKKASIVIQDLTYEAIVDGPDGNNINISYVDGATAGNEIVTVIGTDITVTIEDGVSTAMQISDAVNNSPDMASKIIQDLTYTAVADGVAGNLINIAYAGDGTAGAETVNVDGNTIVVHMDPTAVTGSTATDIFTAVQASVPASALVSVVVSGTGATVQTTQSATFLEGGNDDASALVLVTISGIAGNAQIIQGVTFLEDGFDTSTLRVGMRVVGTGVQAGTTIVSIDSISSITVTPATTATATVALEFQDIFRITQGLTTLSYYATSATNVANHEFKVFLDGTPGSNIQNTCQELLKVINEDSTNDFVYGYYQSGPEDLPGLMLFLERNIGGLEFSFTSTAGLFFNPTLDNTGTNDVSSNDAKPNRAYIAKPGQPEAVPPLQFLPVGSENFPILRGIALRESIFVLKDDGIFKITGNDVASFQVTLFDSSAKLRAPETAVVLNNQIYCFSDQGIIIVSETGVQIISRPIETTLLELSSSLFPLFDDNAFAISYESDRKYIFYCMSDVDDIYPTQAFVYNTLTNSFTRWPLSRSCGIVFTLDNKLYSANQDDLYVYKERKNFDRTDYADNEYNVMIVSFDETTVTLASTTNLAEGDLLKQGDLEASIVSVDSSTDITVDDSLTWLAGAAKVYQAIQPVVQWAQNTAANPGVLKQFSECTVFFKDATIKTIDIGFQTAFDDSFDTVVIDTGSSQGWGLFPWGERPWGIGGGRPLPVRTYVPLEKQRAPWINFKISNKEAWSTFSLTGISVQIDSMGQRFR